MDEQQQKPRRRRPYGLLVTIIILAVAGWTGAWFYIRAQIDRNIDDTLAFYDARGVVLECPERALGGWPFRIELSCRNPSVTTVDGATLEALALRAVGPVWDPNLIIVELDGPLKLSQGARTARATWNTLRASVRTEQGELTRLSVATDRLDVAYNDPVQGEGNFKADAGEIHVLPRPASDPRFSDVAIAGNVRQAVAVQGGSAVLPSPTDGEIDSVLRRVPRGGELNPRAWAANDSVFDLSRLALSEGRLTVAARGALGVETDGRLNGAVRLTATGVETLAADGPVRPQAAALASAFLLFGSAAKDDSGKPGRSLDVSVDRGRVKVGSMAFGALAPLF